MQQIRRNQTLLGQFLCAELAGASVQPDRRAHGGVAIGKPAQVITTEQLSRLYDAPVEVLAGRAPANPVTNP